MATKNFTADPGMFPGLIRKNLNAWYRDGYAVIKELLQNADDAGATNLEIGWAPGLGVDCDYALTNGPGIFVVNDGPFTEEDEQAIRRFGLGNKPDNPNKIGQFGLGLKSVFHLCEAYIYASKSCFPPGNGRPRREFQAFDICNPWSGIAGHPSNGSWDSLPASVGEEIRRYLANVVSDTVDEARPTGWLCLWLPLRRKLWQEPDKNWYFPGEFHGDQSNPPHEIFSHLDRSVATMLPMMRHLRRVRVWMPGAEHLPTAVTSVALEDGGRCLYRYDAPADVAPRQMSGRIEEVRDGKSFPLLYAGVQQKLGDTELARLRSDADHWPRIEGFHDTTGFCVVRAKNDQHAAAYFTRRPTSSLGTLRITWAVFLPLSAEQSAPYPLDCKDEVTLTLHGWFFVDPGRQWADVFHRSTSGSSTIEEQWNRRLAEQGTLRLLIPALEQLVQKCSENDLLPLSVTSAIQSSELFKAYALAICSEQSWGRFIYPAETRWHALNSLAEFVEIPTPSKDHPTGFAFRVFPALARMVSQDISVMLRGTPRLMAALPSVWKTSWVVDLLRSVPLPLAVTDANYLEYLVEFLSDTAGALLISDPSVSAELARIGQAAIGNLSKRPNAAMDVAIQKLVALIATDARTRIAHNDELIGESRRIARTLQASSSRMVLVPAPFDSVQNPCRGKLSTEEAVGQLEVLAEIVSESQQTDVFGALRSLVALDLIRAVSADGEGLRALIAAISHLNLFPVMTLKTNTRSPISMDRLFKAIEHGLLFFQIPAWLKELQRCLRDHEVLYLQQKEVAELIEQVKHRVPLGSAISILNTLGKRPALGGDAACWDLFAAIALELKSLTSDSIASLRYLLHRQPAIDVSAQSGAPFKPLLGVSSRTDDRAGPWLQFGRTILAAIGEEWRIVALEAVERVPANLWVTLGIQKLDKVSVGPLAAELLASSERKAAFTERFGQVVKLQPDIIRLLILDWPRNEETTRILKALPVFEDTAGNLVDITESTRTPGGFSIADSQILPDIRFLRIEDERAYPEYAARLRQLAPPLTAEDAIALVLKRPEPNKRWMFIATTLAANEELYGKLADLLCSTPWLTTAQGDFVAPNRVVYLPECPGIAEWLEDKLGVFVAFGHVDSALRDCLRASGQTPKFSRLLSTGKAAVKLIGDVARMEEAFRVGLESVVLYRSQLKILSEVLGERIADDHVLPGIVLINALWSGWANSEDRERYLHENVISVLQRKISSSRVARVLIALADRHEASADGDARGILLLFNSYLKEARKLTDFSTAVLSMIRLQSRTGKWVSATSLTATMNASEDQMLSGEQGEILGPQESATSSNPVIHDAAVANEELPSYLKSEFADCPAPVLGFLVSLLADPEYWAPIASQLAGPFPLDVVFRSMEWHTPKWFRSWEHAKATCRISVVQAKPDVQSVLNLAGAWIEVPREGQPRSLLDGFHGSQYRPTPEGDRQYTAYFTPVNTGRMTSVEKLTLLKNTAESLLVDLYGQPAEILQDPWRVLNDTGQLSITVAQRLILESSLFHLRGQLGVRSTPRLRDLFQKWDAMRTREAVASQFSGKIDSGDSKAKQAEITEKLRAILVGTAPSERQEQEQILCAIRDRLSATSYDVSSIPFELYQNADDAVAELAWLRGSQAGLTRSNQLNFDVDEQEITVCHWGRAINQYRFSGVTGRDGWDRGFARDLEKMLVLSSSDKGLDSDSGQTTGKFGLGFKSVFFACDEPEVLSGPSLHFQVRGGVFPEPLPLEQVKLFKNELEIAGDLNSDGTLIRLRIKKGIQHREIVHRFLSLAHLLPCFSKSLRSIRICVGDALATVTWKSCPVSGLDDVLTGPAQPLDHNGCALGEELRLIRFASGTESLLLALSPTGFDGKPLHDSPTVWVTAPTQHDERLGLCLNGQFDLNPGRTQLRSTENNNKLADMFGKRLGELLVECYDTAESNWNGFRSTLDLSAITTAPAFWASLWELIAPVADRGGSPEVSDLFRRCLFGSAESGLLKLLMERNALPTRLGSPFENPTTWRKVRYVLDGVLAQNEVLGDVASWSWFGEHVRPGSAVNARVGAAMKQIEPGNSSCVVRLLDAIREEISPGDNVDVATADRLGALINREFLLSLAKDRSTSWESDEITKYLRTLRFRDEAAIWQNAQELLAGHNDGDEFRDERVRASFAPDAKILSRSYTPLGMVFLLACRGPMRATAVEMAEWAIAAEGNAKRMSGVHDYLGSGELARQLGTCLQIHPAFNRSWLRRLANDPELLRDPNRCGSVLSNLGLMHELNPLGPVAATPPTPRSSPGTILDRLYRVWHKRREELLVRYDRSVYPGGTAPQWTMEGLTHDPDCRADWLTLFVLGALHTMGRARDEQHRGFIELCKERGWLHRFAAPTLEANDWLGVLDDYLGRQVDTSEYYHWVNQFVPIYQFARWLPEYAELFLASGRDRGDYVLTDYTRPLSSNRLDRGGVAAPPISRTLGIGACFVTRELVRAGLIINPKAHRHCFVPTHRVRRLLVDVIGAPPFDQARSQRKWEWSCQIHDFLKKHLKERASFDLAFDIPLLLLAKSPDLQAEVFDGDFPDLGDDGFDDETVQLIADDSPQH